jgi:pimeloyl-ACP methyl ester carboxylesterase
MGFIERAGLGVPEPEHIALARPGARGETMALRDWGAPWSGAPQVMLAHANGFCAPTWVRTAAALSRHCHVLAYDARGHGASVMDTSAASLHWNIMHDDFINLLEVLRGAGRLNGAVTAVGHSMGGAAVLCVAGRRPDLINALIALDPVVWWPEMLLPSFSSERKTALVEGARRRRNVFASRNMAYDTWCGRGIFAGWDHAVLSAYLHFGLLDHEDEVRLACAPETEATIFDVNWHEDMRAIVGAIVAPGLVLHAKAGHFRRALHEELAGLAPGLELRDHDGTHFFPMADPLATANLVLEQLNG